MHNVRCRPPRSAQEDGGVPEPDRLVLAGNGPGLEKVPTRDAAATWGGVGARPEPGREVEDGLQHGAEGEGPGARDGLSEPRAVRKAGPEEATGQAANNPLPR